MSGNDYRFGVWLDTFVEEKGFDTERLFEVEGPSGLNIIPLGVVLAAIKTTSSREQEAIQKTLVQIDFLNGDCNHFFAHLAKALAI
jgi:hypothetical protein